MESIMFGCPNSSGMGLYRVNRTLSILGSSFFAGASLLGGFTCGTSTSCTSQELIPSMPCLWETCFRHGRRYTF